MSNGVPSCAVVFKAYAWDGFVERQARRLAQVAGGLDFYILIDETGGPVGPVPFDRVIRFTTAELEAAGLAMRFGLGGVLWWNPDYAHYHFLAQCPNYDHYLFIEYDCVVQDSLGSFVSRAISHGADLIALPIKRPFDLWHWRPYQADVYRPDEVKLALLNVCFLSAPALRLLQQRRLDMKGDPSVRGWPSSEVFLPTEVVRAGMKWLSLAEFGDVSQYDWFPPTLEEDLLPGEQNVFIHPVLDRRRYLTSIFHNRGSLKPGEMKQILARFPRQEYAKLIWPAARSRAVRRIRHKLLRWREQAGW
jgi:hypothetical protein